MKIALIYERVGSSNDRITLSAQLLIKGPAELKTNGAALHVFDTIELKSEEEALINSILSSGGPSAREILNGLISRIVSSAFHKGNVEGYDEAVTKR